jgi:UDP-N-acetylmuramate--alanine ligase
MTPDKQSYDHPSPEAVLSTGADLLGKRGLDPFGRWLLVDVLRQRLDLVENGQIWRSWPVSTAAAGLDNRQDSGGTPPGLHAIERKIGRDAEPGMIFASRQATGILWRPTAACGREGEQDLILTRILTLEGLEEGLNRGPGIDSRERYIYIHGTNQETALGNPVSHGCIRMANSDVIDLFDLVNEGDPVVII